MKSTNFSQALNNLAHPHKHSINCDFVRYDKSSFYRNNFPHFIYHNLLMYFFRYSPNFSKLSLMIRRVNSIYTCEILSHDTTLNLITSHRIHAHIGLRGQVNFKIRFLLCLISSSIRLPAHTSKTPLKFYQHSFMER